MAPPRELLSPRTCTKPRQGTRLCLALLCRQVGREGLCKLVSQTAAAGPTEGHLRGDGTRLGTAATQLSETEGGFVAGGSETHL